MAIHAPITGAPTRAHFVPVPPAAVSRILSRFDRARLGAFISVAIDLLDAAEGDDDLEVTGLEDDFIAHAPDGPGCPVGDIDHCTADDDDPAKLVGDYRAGDPDDREDDDPAGDPLDESGEEQSDDGRALLAARLEWGPDQSEGPTNYGSASAEHQAKILGLVRSPSGGWRWPTIDA